MPRTTRGREGGSGLWSLPDAGYEAQLRAAARRESARGDGDAAVHAPPPPHVHVQVDNGAANDAAAAAAAVEAAVEAAVGGSRHGLGTEL
jgi:hypothetical protein